MQYTALQIKDLTRLQQEHHNLTMQISYIKTMMHKLLNHDCKTSYQVIVHDEEQHKENKAADEAQEIIQGALGDAWFLGMPVPNGISLPKRKPCNQTLQFTCSEATAIRMLSALLQEKQEERMNATKAWNDLIAKNNIIITNPITDLYNEK